MKLDSSSKASSSTSSSSKQSQKGSTSTRLEKEEEDDEEEDDGDILDPQHLLNNLSEDQKNVKLKQQQEELQRLKQELRHGSNAVAPKSSSAIRVRTGEDAKAVRTFLFVILSFLNVFCPSSLFLL
jgi:FKBP-type peptidyl-prolyl cis-trans isomerase